MNLFVFILLVLLASFCGYLFFIMPGKAAKDAFAPFVGYWYAHRGYHDNATDAPENSLRAFALAVENGYGMELDIQLSKDGEIVVFHDDTLTRACGVSGKVGDYTYAELQTFRLFDSDATIPLFREVLAVIDGKTPLIVEFKTTTPNIPLCKAGSQMLQEYHGAYCIESFHPAVVQWYRKNYPSVVRGQLSCAVEGQGLQHVALAYLLTNVFTRPHFVAYDHLAKNNPSRRLCRGLFHNCAVAWTVQSQQALDACKGDFDFFIFEGFAPQE